MRVTRTTDPNGNVLCAAVFSKVGTARPMLLVSQQSLVHTKMLVRVGVPVHRR